MKINILTIFPNLFESFLNETLIKRAIKSEKLEINIIDIRDFANDKHHTTDDTPYGGGPGMVMKVEPIYHALKSIEKGIGKKGHGTGKIALLSPRGKQFSQSVVKEYAELKTLTLVCGRYEGVDQRVVDHLVDEELSIGPYVLSGGEVPAMVVIEAVSRYVPGILGNPDSLTEESWNLPLKEDKETDGRSREYPQYTRPPEFMGWKVPDVLLSGNHEEIRAWRQKQANIES